MRVYIDRKPFEGMKAIRGEGYYTKYLVEAVSKFHPEVHITDDVKEADLAHFTYFDLFFPTLKPPKKIPTLVTVHDVIPLLFPKQYPIGIKGKIAFWRQKKALHKMKAVLTVSEHSKHDIHKYLQIPINKIHTVYQAVDETFQMLPEEQVSPVRLKYNLPSRFVLYVGDVNYNKNIPTLIQAFSEVKDPLVSLILVGKSFTNEALPETQRINTEILKLQLGDRVRKLGFVPDADIAAIFNAASVYVQPSLYEGFGIPVLNAFACGTAVVCANTSSLSEIAKDAAYLVDPYNYEQMGFGINQLLTVESVRKQYEEAGLARAKDFSQKQFADAVTQVYTIVIEKRNV